MAQSGWDLDHKLGARERSSRRVRAYLTVEVLHELESWTALTTNVSEGGLFLATHNFAAVGTVLTLLVRLPLEPQSVLVFGEVRWVRHESHHDDFPPGLGLRFVEVPPLTLAPIRRFLLGERALGRRH